MTSHQLAKWLLKQPNKPCYLEYGLAAKSDPSGVKEVVITDAMIHPRLSKKRTRMLISSRNVAVVEALKKSAARGKKK